MKINFVFILIIFIFFLSCKNQDSKPIKNSKPNQDSKSNKDSKPNKDSIVVIENQKVRTERRQFSENKHLFLNFYSGMNFEEYKNAVKENLVLGNLFLKISKEEYKKKGERYYISEPSNMLGIDGIKSNDFIKNGIPDSLILSDLVVYKYTIKGNIYFANITFYFDISPRSTIYKPFLPSNVYSWTNLTDEYKLAMIELSPPVFTWEALSKKEKNTLYEDSKKMKNILLNLYTQKYMKPIIQDNNLGNKLILLDEKPHDYKNYIFITKTKYIEIQRGFSNYYEPTVSYQVLDEVKLIQKAEEDNKNKFIRIKKENNKKTMNEI